ncbi:hypothetical protein Pst134EA_005409 [Puccinia striiformis f. sp. tritici]|uniref:hypothetical protein n=1 Tax=Puccinia striiformis f. sp. tritici TaxID=168172 RepID=UPI002007285F|nr:hypothetical protein Pst134EA_005409 [Puccinia striiformis f. sp. tritici]KAH9471514.1 hypothetical protein Pst134EA_005409 [Puccinia striiformis f. sp. tritici]
MLLLAGTGFGKSRIAEMYYQTIPEKDRAVIVTLNPLDGLGNNQVLEKELAGFTAINLTKLNFNKKTAADITKGVYQFVYLSPEIYLNNKLWDELYFSPQFQNRLGLIVVDEAHVIFIWGLVQSCKGTNTFAVHIRHEDSGIFRPSYGNLGGHLLFRNEKPILLLSATCRPVAVAAIKKSLKLDDDSIDMLRGELTRPEIRIIRAPMDNSLASSLDVIKVFPSGKDITDDKLVPALVYSGSRNRTLTVLEVIDRARESHGACYSANSKCTRRYHSCSGDLDKLDTVRDFADAKFPIISCTMALGLGQNWKRVRKVVHMGRGDPASISQMIGRCGRDGRPGLAVLFMEKTRRKGKNSVAQFTRGAFQTDEDRLDALAITPVCLRIAFSLDNLLGYIPLWFDDPAYIIEREREKFVGFAACRCSNCLPVKGLALLNNLVFADQNNLDQIVTDDFQPPFIVDLKHKYPVKRAGTRKRKFNNMDRASLDVFREELVDKLAEFYDEQDVSGGDVEASDFFGTSVAELLVTNLHNIESPSDIRNHIGGECFDGQLQWLMKTISSFKINQEANTAARCTIQPAPKKKRCLTSTATQPAPSECLTQPAALGTNTNPSAPDAPLSKKAQAQRARDLKKLAKEKKVQVEQARQDQLAGFTKASKEKYNLEM